MKEGTEYTERMSMFLEVVNKRLSDFGSGPLLGRRHAVSSGGEIGPGVTERRAREFKCPERPLGLTKSSAAFDHPNNSHRGVCTRPAPPLVDAQLAQNTDENAEISRRARSVFEKVRD